MLAALGFAAAFVALYLVALGTDIGSTLDSNAVVALSEARSPRVYRATIELHDTISTVSIALFGAACAALAGLRRRFDLALGALVLIGAANVTTQLAKPFLGSLDPTGGDALRVSAAAFPSGHATVAASLAAALVLVSPPGLRLVAAAGGALYAAGVGISLVLLGAHYPSDVAGAYLLVGAWASLVVAALAVRPAPRQRPAARPGLRRVAVGLLAVCFAAVLAICVGVAVARAPRLLTAIRGETSFFAAAAVLAVLATAIIWSLALVLDRERPRTG